MKYYLDAPCGLIIYPEPDMESTSIAIASQGEMDVAWFEKY